MDPNEPLARLLRLRGMVARSVPSDGAKLSYQDAAGLADAYIRLREPVRSFAVGLGVDQMEFDAELPELARPREPHTSPDLLMKLGSEASHENDGLNWPHRDGLNWPHLRPIVA